MKTIERRRVIGRVILVLSVAVIIMLGFAGCPTDDDDKGVSQRARVSALQSDLNNDYSRVYRNWHPQTTTRDLGADTLWVETAFGPVAERQFSFSIASYNESNNTATGTLSSDGGLHSNRSVTFTFELDGKDWMISKLEMTGRTTLQSVR